MKRRILSIIMAMAMTLSLMAVPAFAEEGDAPTGTPITADITELTTGEYYLEGDVTFTEPLKVTGEVTIDLAGHKIINSTLEDSEGVIEIASGASLVVKDSKTDGEIYGTAISGGGTKYPNVIHNSGTFTLQNGTLKIDKSDNNSSNPTGIYIDADSKTQINDGKIVVEKSCSAGKLYGIYVASGAKAEMAISGGEITVTDKASSGKYMYGIYLYSSSSHRSDLNVTGGKISVTGTGSTYGIYINSVDAEISEAAEVSATGKMTYGIYSNSTSAKIDIKDSAKVTATGTSTTYGVSFKSALDISGGTITAGTSSATSSVYGVYVNSATDTEKKISDGTITASTSGSGKVYSVMGKENDLITITDGEFTGAASFCLATGGTFSEKPTGAFPPYVYEAVESDGKWVIQQAQNPTNRVKNTSTNTEYPSLQQAVDEATAGNTLELSDDYDVQGFTVNIAKPLTLDLKGHTISNTVNDVAALSISGGTKDNSVKITDSTASQKTAGTISAVNGITVTGGYVGIEKIHIKAETNNDVQNQAVKIIKDANANVTLTGVNVSVKSAYENSSYFVSAVYVEEGNEAAVVTVGDTESFETTMTVEASLAPASVFYIDDSETAQIVVKSGTFSADAKDSNGDYACVLGNNSKNVGILNIEGGNFTITSTSTNKISFSWRDANDIEITGGTFNIDPSAYLPTGYVITKNEQTYTVKMSNMATVNDQEYNDLQKAVNAAINSTASVVLTANAIYNETLEINSAVTIEKGRYSLSLNGVPAVKLASGVELPEALDGMFEAYVENDDGSRAYYKDFTSAIGTGKTIVFVKDVTISDPIARTTSYTLDLNGYDLTSTDDEAILFSNVIAVDNVVVSIENSSDELSVVTGGISIVSNGTVTLNIGENVEVKDNSPLFMQGGGKAGCITANIYGSLTVEVDGTEEPYGAIQGNGNIGNGGTVVNIYEPAKITNEQTGAIYHPQDGVINVYGGEITGVTGIEMRAGELNVYGGTITATGEFSETPNGSGSTVTGAAIAVSQHVTELPVKVNIVDGAFSGEKALYETTLQNNSPEAIEKIEISVSGGTFTTTDTSDGAKPVESKNVEDFISGGTFNKADGSGSGSTTPIKVDEELLAPNTQIDPDTGTVTVNTPSHGSSSGSSGYAITVPSNIKNGDVTVSPSRATAGTVVTITVKPDAGYELDSLTVTDKNGGTVALKDIGSNKYTFTMPSGAVKIAAEFVEETPVSTLPFTDVAADAWYYDAVEYVYDNDLMNGTSSTVFAPNATLTRGMLATVLWRMEGSPVVNYALPFEDVSGGQWYTEAIRWAASVGVVNGTSATTYAPNANITREQLATMLYRYAAYKSGSVSTSASLSGFTDAGSVSDYAADAMEWAVAEEIIGGMTSTTLVPQGSATRAQTATMLMRYCENVL